MSALKQLTLIKIQYQGKNNASHVSKIAGYVLALLHRNARRALQTTISTKMQVVQSFVSMDFMTPVLSQTTRYSVRTLMIHVDRQSAH